MPVRVQETWSKYECHVLRSEQCRGRRGTEKNTCTSVLEPNQDDTHNQTQQTSCNGLQTSCDGRVNSALHPSPPTVSLFFGSCRRILQLWRLKDSSCEHFYVETTVIKNWRNWQFTTSTAITALIAWGWLMHRSCIHQCTGLESPSPPSVPGSRPRHSNQVKIRIWTWVVTTEHFSFFNR